MKISLLITTYNWPEALELVLKSVKQQTLIPDEIIIADDGSTEETLEVIRKFETELPVKHVWHEDKGFRRTVILNKAIAQAKGDYIIQLDGDCILHKNFVEDHKKRAKKNVFLFGSRVNIREEFSSVIFLRKNIDFSFFDKRISKRTRNLHIPFFSRFYGGKNKLSKKLRGCNLSYWKHDLVKINGYNEDMTGWGKEDSEMVIRLLNVGVVGIRLRYSGIIYHLWHKENSRESFNKNFEIEQQAIQKKKLSCKNGINKYL